MATCSRKNEAFERALQKILKSLPPCERERYSPCSSCKDLSDGLKKIDHLLKQWEKKRFWRHTKAIDALNEHLGTYFKAVDIFVQGGSKCGSTIWGSLRIVLQLASNFSTFFEKLLSWLQEISHAFPRYREISELHQGPGSERIRLHLEQVYSDLLQFFQKAAEIFTSSKGKSRSTAKVISTIMWTPVDVQFENLLKRLRRHQEFVDHEIALLHAKQFKQAEAAAEKARSEASEERSRANAGRKMQEDYMNDAKYADINRWINPPDYADAFEQASSLREEGSGLWIFQKPAFQEWQNGSWSTQPESSLIKALGPRILYIQGNPGAGKTVLMSTIIQHLQEYPSISNMEPRVCYHFFSSELSRARDADPMGFYRATLSQILHQTRQNPSIFDKFVFASASKSGQPKASKSELIELLELCFEDIGPIYLIIDGIDECSDPVTLIKMLGTLVQSPGIKIITAGRPTIPGLARRIRTNHKITVTRDLISNDIEMYLMRSIEQLIEEEYLPAMDPSSLVGRLVNGADGMFLWARLMVKFLCSPLLRPEQRLSMIKEIKYPEGIETMYNRIFDFIDKSGRLHQSMARKVFCWLTYSTCLLTVRDMYTLVYMNETADYESSTTIEEFRETLHIICGSLVETYIGGVAKEIEELREPPRRLHGCYVRFIHLSVSEHIKGYLDPHDYSPTLKMLRNSSFGNSHIASDCIQSLQSLVPGSDMDGLSLSGYAILNWPYHLEKIGKSQNSASAFLTVQDFDKANEDLVTRLSKFIQSSAMITRWIFSFYELQSSNNIPVNAFRAFTHWLQSSSYIRDDHPLLALHEELVTLTTDLQRLVKEWGQRLQSEPSVIYDEVPAFLQSRFILSNPYTTVTGFTAQTPSDHHSSFSPLCTISKSSLDGSINCVLRIWPSKAFEQRWKSFRENEPVSAVENVCSNWIASYEAWDVRSKSRLLGREIQLDKGEVWLQLRQSLYERTQGDWKTAFPMAISHDIQSIVVLRTMYAFVRGSNGSGVTLDSATPRMEFSAKIRSIWSNDLAAFDPNNPKFKRRKRYTYSFDFSPNDRYLSFRDTLEEDIGERIWVNNLAIFEISRQDDDLSVDLVSHVVRFGQDISQTMSFHPTDEIVVYIMEEHVLLWEFKKGSTTVLESIYRKEPKSVRISSCGKYVVIWFEGESTDIIEIPASYFRKSGTECVEAPHSRNTTSLLNLVQIGNSEISDFKLKPGQAVTDRCIVNSSTNDTASTVTHVQGGHSPAIKLSATNQGVTTNRSLELLSLPMTPNVEHTIPTVLIPKTADEDIRVIVNMSSFSEYSMVETDETFPALIERDARLVRLSTFTPNVQQTLMQSEDNAHDQN